MVTQVNGDTGVSQCQPNSVSQDDLQSGVAGKGPAFSARHSTAQNIPASTVTVIQFDTEEFDTNGCYDPVTFRFTPTIAGYYQINAGVQFSPFTLQSGGEVFILLRKNGLSYKRGVGFSGSGNPIVASPKVSTLVFMNGTTDYLDVVTYQNSAGAVALANDPSYSSFQGFLARSAT